MVYNMVHDIWKNAVEVQVFFVAHVCTKSLHKAHEMCIKISSSFWALLKANNISNYYMVYFRFPS